MEAFKEELEPIKTAIALGAEIGAIAGSVVFEVNEYGGEYEDHQDISCGLFSNKEAAQNQVLDCIYQNSAWIDKTPWGDRPQDDESQTSPSDPWHLARKKWFESNSFDDIFDWYHNGGRDYEQHSFRITRHTVNGLSPLRYDLPAPRE